MSDKTVITGVGIALSGAETAADVLAPATAEPVDPAARIGKKGLRYKDRATHLAMVAANDALRDAGLLDGEGLAAKVNIDPHAVAVVVSSNFGNLDSVADVIKVIADDGGTRLVSPIVTPNLSSNVIASEVAIRFTLRGPNLMVCNGATGGLDAVSWAQTYLRASRATHVLVIGSESDNQIVRDLVGSDKVLDGAVAVVVELASVAAERGATTHAEVADYVRTGSVDAAVTTLAQRADGVPAGWYTPGDDVAESVLPGTERFDLAATWGQSSGALGVLQVVSAIGRFASGATEPVFAVSGTDTDDASAALLVRPTGSFTTAAG